MVLSFTAVLLLLAIAPAVGAATKAPKSCTISPAIRKYVDHPGFTWIMDCNERFQFFYEPDAVPAGSFAALKQSAERQRGLVLELVGELRYPHTINIFLVQSPARMKELIGYEVDGRSRPNQHAVFYVVAGSTSFIHEFSHEIAANVWGPGEPWIAEGLAVYMSDYWRLLHGKCKYLADTRQLIALSRLVNNNWASEKYPSEITYIQLGSFVKFLYETYGLDKIKRSWRHGSADLPQVYGKSIDELEHEWRAVVAKQTAKIEVVTTP